MKLMPKMNCLLLLLLSSVLGAPTVNYVSSFLDDPEYDLPFAFDELIPWDIGSTVEDQERILALLKCKLLLRSAEGFVPQICKELN
nr:ORF9 [Luchacovirus sp.]